MSDLVKGTPEGIRWTTAVTSAATTSFDLSTWARRWVKIIVDQNCLFAFSSHTAGNAAGPGDMATSGDVTLGQRVLVAGTDVGFKVVADDVDAGSLGVHRFVDPKYPFLLLRAKATSTALVKIKPASDKLGSE
jgi:hypothetical protein